MIEALLREENLFLKKFTAQQSQRLDEFRAEVDELKKYVIPTLNISPANLLHRIEQNEINEQFIFDFAGYLLASRGEVGREADRLITALHNTPAEPVPVRDMADMRAQLDKAVTEAAAYRDVLRGCIALCGGVLGVGRAGE